MTILFGEKDTDIKVKFERIAYNNMARCEAHEEYEFYCLTEGERYLFVNSSFYHLKAGDVFLIAPGVEHRTLDAGGGYARLVTMLPRFHFPVGSEPKCDLFAVRPEGALAETVRKQVGLLAERAQGDDGGLGAYSLVLTLLETVLSCENIADGITVATPTLGRVADILKYIDAHYAERITLTSLSEKFYLSEFYLCRLFKEYTGRTVLGYLTSLRVRQAKRLLTSTDMAVGRVARACGFGSVSAFGSAFRAAAGCSPREWRKNNAN